VPPELSGILPSLCFPFFLLQSLLELFKFLDGPFLEPFQEVLIRLGILGDYFQGFFVKFYGELRLAALHVGLGQAVVHVG